MIKNKIFTDSIWNIFDYISTVIISLITAKFLLQEIHTDGYGFYMFFTGLIGTFGLVDMGMGMAVSKYLSEYLHQKKYTESNQIITFALLFYGATGGILFFLIFIFVHQIITFLNFDQKFFAIGTTILIITSLIFIVNLITGIMINTLVALEEWKNISMINIILKVINGLLLITVVLLSVDLDTKLLYLFLLLFGFAIVKLLTYFFIVKRKYIYFSFIKPNKIIKEKIFNFLKVSSLQYVLSIFVHNVDKFIISIFFGLNALGIYSFVFTVYASLYGLLSNSFKVFLPKLSKLHGNQQYNDLKKYFKKISIYSFLMSTILASIVLLVWKTFISIYLTNEFANQSFPYIQVFALLLIVRSLEPVFYYFFNAIAKPSVLVVNLFIGAILTISGYLLFIPVLDIFGIVIAQIVSNICVYLYNFYMIKKRGFNEYTK